MPPLVALESASVVLGVRAILDGVSLGVDPGQRIGVVGRNGDGKSTLLRALAGLQELDAGRRIISGAVRIELVAQSDELPAQAQTVADAVVGSAPEHVWAADPRVRAVLVGLLGGVAAQGFAAGMATALNALSGGERRRVALARALVDPGDLLILDEPTNHLDLHAVAWLAQWLTGPYRPPALVVVTHDRWFLDAVCTATWEVVDGQVNQFEGGYAAWVLAKAERERRTALAAARRRNALTKELAWLRRGPPARTSKPAFRIAAANALIADVPAPRDTIALRKLAAARLGRKVVDLESVSLAVPVPAAGLGLAQAAGGKRTLFRDLDWQLGPGDRIGLIGPNGAGKTSLVRLLLGEIEPDSGSVVRGSTVVAAVLPQVIEVHDPDDHVLQNLERLRREFTLAGRSVTATNLLDEFGFRGPRALARLGDLSGGELRRFELLKLLLGSPNLIVLDEPTNDLDVATLAVIEDALDSWPGTLIVISHDRYFLERNCDSIYAVPGDGRLVHLPGGVDQYLSGDLPGPPPRQGVRTRTATPEAMKASTATPGAMKASTATPGATSAATAPPSGATSAGVPAEPAQGGLKGAAQHSARKELARLEARLVRIEAETTDLHAQMALAATDHQRLVALSAALTKLNAEQERVEESWLELAERLGE